jgi:hypothetical protein
MECDESLVVAERDETFLDCSMVRHGDNMQSDDISDVDDTIFQWGTTFIQADSM